MGKSIASLENLGFFILSILAVVFHFLYSLSGNSVIVGVFSPVNESVWEHYKLFFYPIILYAIAEYFIAKPPIKSFIVAKAVSLIFILITYIVVFYSYTYFTGKSIVLVDIMSTFVYIAISLVISYKITTTNFDFNDYYIGALSVIIALFIILTVYTFNPPTFDLFIPH